MSRPLCIEFPGAVYHITSRGNRREPIFADDADRKAFLEVLGQAMDRFDAQVLAYCLMGNHYHLVLFTRQGNLSRLMRHINGTYTQMFNRRHALSGHLLQGRFKSILVDRDSYLLELCRYVELNPVRARMVPTPQDWPWSSYLAHGLHAPTPPWLDSDGLHGYLLGTPVRSLADRQKAARLYTELLQSASDLDLWSRGLRKQIYLGDEVFVERMQMRLSARQRNDKELARTQRTPPAPACAAALLQRHCDRDLAILAAYRSGGKTMSEIAAQLRLSVSRVSRIIRSQEEKVAKGKT
jgi:putative transposase